MQGTITEQLEKLKHDRDQAQADRDQAQAIASASLSSSQAELAFCHWCIDQWWADSWVWNSK